MIEDTDKIRRAINLCTLFTLNMAYYRASFRNSKYIGGNNNFSITISGNFIDISIVEWCKLFGSYDEDHHWMNLVGDNAEQFRNAMLVQVGMTESEFRQYHQSMKNYRDVFVTHWDDDGMGNIPPLDKAFECVVFLHEYIFTHFKSSDALYDKVKDLRSYYEEGFKEAQKCYGASSE